MMICWFRWLLYFMCVVYVDIIVINWFCCCNFIDEGKLFYNDNDMIFL